MPIRKIDGGYMADAGKNPTTGQRERKRTKTKELARSWLAEVRARREREGSETLTTQQRLDAMQALHILDGRTTLAQAARSWVAGTHTSPKASDALTAYLAAKSALNRRPRTLDEIRLKIGSLINVVGDKQVSKYGPDDIEMFLHGFTPASRNQYMTVIGGFFRWCEKRGHVNKSPVNALDRSSVDQKPTEIHTPDQVRALLSTALADHPMMLTWYALGYFCGLRTAELEATTYKDLDLDGGHVLVRPEVAKKRRQRYVDIPECAVAWIKAGGGDKMTGPLFFGRTLHRSIVEKAGVDWPRNVMRHSFGSYHLAYHGDGAKTAMALGHTNVAVVYDHYRNPVLSQAAQVYFALSPEPSCLHTGQGTQAAQ